MGFREGGYEVDGGWEDRNGVKIVGVLVRKGNGIGVRSREVSLCGCGGGGWTNRACII